MKITILIDNKSANNLCSEWGFCVHIENDNKHYLLDTGSSDKYLTNAKTLGIDIKDIDYAILSHCHIDHSGGYKSFFKENNKAKLYISKNYTTSCFCKVGFLKFIVGMPKYIINNYSDRIVYVGGLYNLDNNVYLMEHKNKGLINKHLVKKIDKKYIFDDFSHEQNLIFDTDKGLVILNSCSHIGLDEIIKEVNEAFPNKKIYMMVGELHLALKSKKYDRQLAEEIKKLNIDYIYTGHCTKEKGFKVLKSVLNDKVIQVKSGMIINV